MFNFQKYTFSGKINLTATKNNTQSIKNYILTILLLCILVSLDISAIVDVQCRSNFFFLRLLKVDIYMYGSYLHHNFTFCK